MSKIRYLQLQMALLILFGMASMAFAQSAGAPTKTAPKILYVKRQMDLCKAKLVELAEYRENTMQELSDLKAIHEKLQKEQDEQGISGDSFAEVIKSLQSQRVELMIDLAGMEARRSTIFELKKQMQNESTDIVDQLGALLKIEEEEMARMELLYKKGSTSRSEYQRAKSRLLEIKIRLAEAKKPSKGSTVLNDELLNSSLNRAEKKARLEKTENLLTTFTSSRKTLEKAVSTKSRISNTERKLAQVENEVHVLADQLESWKRQLSELGNADKKSDDQ